MVEYQKAVYIVATIITAGIALILFRIAFIQKGQYSRLLLWLIAGSIVLTNLFVYMHSHGIYRHCLEQLPDMYNALNAAACITIIVLLKMIYQRNGDSLYQTQINTRTMIVMLALIEVAGGVIASSIARGLAGICM